MIEPLRISFVVSCPADHAFEVWTAKASQWWPPGHTMSQEPGAEVVFESHPGGRIYERTRGGIEMEWGEVTVWEPPHRLCYLWHIATDRASATDVEITFHDQGDDTTRVDVEHSGWERLAERGADWRRVNRGGWDGVIPAFTMAAQTA